MRHSRLVRAALLLAACCLASALKAEVIIHGAADVESGVPAGVSVTGSGEVSGGEAGGAQWSMDGVMVGVSLAEPLTLTGAVQGIGSFDNVVFDGEFSPGHSPAHVTVGSVIYTSSNNLIMELGGLLPGSQYDKITHTGLSLAGGTLTVTLINGFNPSLGNVFDIFDWNAGVVGSFATTNLPALNPGLAWDASDVLIGGTLVVVNAIPEASAFFCGVVAALLLAGSQFRQWRRRRSA